MAGQLLLALTIMVGLHEFGHLWAAKAFGMRVEKYYIGFPPKIIGKKFGETEYALGAIPLGGFVKISGMIDESLDTKSMSSEPEPWEFRAKPAWQRLIVMLGGIIMNVATGILVFVVLAKMNGDPYIPKSEIVKHGIEAGELGKKMGLQTGDVILDINGEDYDRFSDLVSPDVLLGSNAFYTIQRSSEQLRINLPSNLLEEMADDRERLSFIQPRLPFEVGLVSRNPGLDAGLTAGDKITGLNGTPVTYFDELKSGLDTLASQPITLQVSRNGQKMELKMDLSEEGTIGFAVASQLNFIKNPLSLAQALTQGTQRAFGVVYYNIVGFGKMFSGEVDARKSLSGPIGIARFFGGQWDWMNFWRLIGLLSMVLAFMNLLPIPALDGGHVMFISYEIISGRKPGEKFLENAQKVGMVILLALMVFVIGNDIIKLF